MQCLFWSEANQRIFHKVTDGHITMFTLFGPVMWILEHSLTTVSPSRCHDDNRCNHGHVTWPTNNKEKKQRNASYQQQHLKGCLSWLQYWFQQPLTGCLWWLQYWFQQQHLTGCLWWLQYWFQKRHLTGCLSCSDITAFCCMIPLFGRTTQSNGHSYNFLFFINFFPKIPRDPRYRG